MNYFELFILFLKLFYWYKYRHTKNIMQPKLAVIVNTVFI